MGKIIIRTILQTILIIVASSAHCFAEVFIVRRSPVKNSKQHLKAKIKTARTEFRSVCNQPPCHCRQYGSPELFTMQNYRAWPDKKRRLLQDRLDKLEKVLACNFTQEQRKQAIHNLRRRLCILKRYRLRTL